MFSSHARTHMSYQWMCFSLFSTTEIDHILTNYFLNNDIKTGIIKSDISDHFPIFLISNKYDIDLHVDSTTIFKRSTDSFKDTMNEINCPNEAYNKFMQKFSTAYDKTFPEVKIKIKTKTLSP